MAENGLTASMLKTLAEDIQKVHADLRKSLHRSIEYVFEMGRMLVDAEAHVPHGDWTRWVDEEAGINPRLAQRWMRVFRNRDILPKSTNLSVLSIDAALSLISASENEDAAKLLAGPEAAQALPNGSRAPSPPRQTLYDEVANTAPKDANGNPVITATHVKKVAAKRATPTEVKQQAKHDALTAAEQHAKAEQVTVPWGVFVESVNACLDKLEDIRDELNELLDGKKGENKNRHAFAHFIPYLGTIGSVDAAIKCVRENLPAAAHADKPYYMPVRSVKMRGERGGK